MEEVRSKIFRGKFMTSDGGRAELDPRKAAIRKGMFLVSAAPACRGEFVKVPDHLEHHAPSIAEILNRLRAVRASLDTDTRARRR